MALLQAEQRIRRRDVLGRPLLIGLFCRKQPWRRTIAHMLSTLGLRN